MSSRSLFAPILFFISALCLAGYTLFYNPLASNHLRLFRYIQMLQKENQQYRTQNKDTLSHTPSEKENHYLPTFLFRIHTIAEKNGISLKKFIPDNKNPNQYNLEFISDYLALLRFTADMESLDLELEDIQIHSFEKIQSQPLLMVTFVIRPNGMAQPLSGKRLEKLQQRVLESNHRNPFQQAIVDDKNSISANITDISASYKLSGIGVEGGIPYATINHKNYREGESIAGMKIINIQKNKVYLEKRSHAGIEQFLLQFHTNKTLVNKK
ncbi:MAG: hypothetical protein H7832_09555 [Magnetococcus sp. DMHC-6]